MIDTNLNNQSANAPIASHVESNIIEVSGLMDDFISLEEFAPDSNWEEVLAARWGIPYAAQSTEPSPYVGLKESCLRFLRSIVQSVQSKKFEAA